MPYDGDETTYNWTLTTSSGDSVSKVKTEIDEIETTDWTDNAPVFTNIYGKTYEIEGCIQLYGRRRIK